MRNIFELIRHVPSSALLFQQTQNSSESVSSIRSSGLTDTRHIQGKESASDGLVGALCRFSSLQSLALMAHNLQPLELKSSNYHPLPSSLPLLPSV